MTEPARAQIVVGVVLSALALGALAAGRGAFAVLVAAVSLVAAGELFRLIRRRGVRPLPIVGFFAIAGMHVLAYRGPDDMLLGIPGVVGGTVVVSFAVLIARRRTAGALIAVASTVSAAIAVGVLGSFVSAMRSPEYGFRVGLAFLLMAGLNRVFARVGGRAFGRHPMAPSIDPTKTWEGFAAGTTASLAAALFVSWQMDPPFRLGRAVLLAAIVAAAAPLGDLVNASITGHEPQGDAPARGGVLDHVAGLLFAAPLFYFAYRAMVR